jgi:hypothetical protein
MRGEINPVAPKIKRKINIVTLKNSMSQLCQLLYGKSKKRMSVIMVDEKHKCENYQRARECSTNGWHKIELASPGSTVWRQKSATIGGNKPTTVKRHGEGLAGYIGKNGFNPHT